MRLFNVLLAATSLLALTSTVAFAQTPAVEKTPIPALAKPDFSKMFLGAWRCSTKSSRRAWSYETTSTSSVRPDGYWLETTSHIAKTPVAAAFQSTDLVTYDAATKRWVDIQTDEQGNYSVATSPGWHGDTIVWTTAFAPKSAGIASINPTSITRMSATKYTSFWSFIETDGRQVTVNTICNKL
jgi:hypothetical protein